MAEQFNPYREWLSLDVPGGTPDFFQLLGLPPSETDVRRISAAADRASAKVRSSRPGPHAAAWAKLLDTIADAKRCLSDPHTREQYQARLASGRGANPADASRTDSRKVSGRPLNPNPSARAANAPPQALDETRFAPERENEDDEEGRPLLSPAARPTLLPPTIAAGTAPSPMAPYVPGTSAGSASTAAVDPMAPVSIPRTAMPVARPAGGGAGPTTGGGERPDIGALDVYGKRGKARYRRRNRMPAVVLTLGLLVVLAGGTLFLVKLVIERHRASTGQLAQQATELPATPPGNSAPATGPAPGVALPPLPVASDAQDARPRDASPFPAGNPVTLAPGTGEPAGRGEPMTVPPGAMPAMPEAPLPGIPEMTNAPAAAVPTPMPMPMPMPTPKPTPAPAPTPPPPTPEEVAALNALLAEVRDAVSKQQFRLADTKLTKAGELAKSPEQQALVAQARAVSFYAAEFRKALENAVQGFQPADNIQVGQSTYVSIVSSEPDRITLRVAGTTRTYNYASLPWALALAIADTWLDTSQPSSYAAKAAYLMSLPKRDENAWKRAQEFLQTAADGRIDVSDLRQGAEAFGK